MSDDDLAPDDRERVALAQQGARERMMNAAMRAAREQLRFMARAKMLPIDADSAVTTAMLAAMGMAGVTAAQGLVDSVIETFSKHLAALEARIAKLEAAHGEVAGLAVQLTDALQRLGTPTREEFDRISKEVFGQKRAEIQGVEVHDDDPDSFVHGNFARLMVPLAPGEVAPPMVTFALPPPEGMRWESDAELRARLKARGSIPRFKWPEGGA